MSDSPATVKPPAENWDVVVIGAGPAGSLAALLLARSGHQVLLLERQKFPRAKVCGCCLNQRAQLLLQRADLLTGLLNLHPGKTRQMNLHFNGRTLPVPMPGGLAVSRRSMDQWLAEEATAAGVCFQQESVAEVLPEDCDTEHLTARTLPASRIVRITNAEGSRIVAGKVVLVCDGLGHSSLAAVPGFASRPRRGARIGLGAVLTAAESAGWLQPGEILMAASAGGYCGAVQTEDGSVNLAAAVDAAAIQNIGSPRNCLQQIFAAAGVAIPPAFESLQVRGTVPLTRNSARIVGHRLLLLGDATGYVEPFTGEGMAWALTAATLAAPVAHRGISSGWNTALQQQYQRQLRAAVVREQTVCRSLSWILSRPGVLKWSFAAATMLPMAAAALVRRVNRVPLSLEGSR